MSESDETDILLLIPPDFFNCESPVPKTQRKAATNCSLDSVDYLSYASFSTIPMAGIENCPMARCSASDRTEQYVASTPYKRHHGQHRETHKERYLLNEIDQFLQEGDTSKSYQRQHQRHNQSGVRSPHESLIDLNGLSLNEYPSLTANDFNNLAKPIPSAGGPVPQKPPRNVQSSSMAKPYSNNANLLNLSDIWHTNGAPDYGKVLQEERLRRQHCERNIQSLQIKLLEYEEKMSVALSVDKEKLEIIGKLEQEVNRLTNRIRDMEGQHIQTHEKLMAENVEVRNKNLMLEKELADTVNLTRKLQEKKDTLEQKVDNLASANRDVNEVHRKQQEDLQIRLANSRESERQLKEQLSSLRNANEQLKVDLQSEKQKLAECVGIREELRSIKRKHELLAKQYAEATQENVSLQEQTKHMKQQITIHQEESKNLLKELEIQRLSLKKYYQSQLEDVVTDKLNEFQKQLTTVEQELKAEAAKKERALADRAKRQIELIDQKREQEVQLLTERYNEQESLYRLQLANSAKRIHELEDKLRSIQQHRADIASQLHLIMENQWKQALDVLMSPGQHAEDNGCSKVSDQETKSRHFQRFTLEQLDKDRLDGVRSLKQTISSDPAIDFQTPQPNQRQACDMNGEGPPLFPKHLLHNYIELLLEKSPNDLKHLEEVLSSCRKQSKKEVNGYNGEPVDGGNLGKSASAMALSQLGKKSCSKSATRPWK
ncbi:CAP-Gly domain-containing linker protein 1 [Anopheles aquasalis]|uniref:CAP-Gly domain-containing linker protein 1 n=1 Tax=Anopheles aquasalis TaxID=42839 RepID=UPI00215ABEEB|nr:CAP-Gly domain-containing linker protein 1 [Anopheles aquasalis]